MVARPFRASLGFCGSAVYHDLGLLSHLVSKLRSEYIKIAEFYTGVEVLVDGKDVSGTTALLHCFSTTPRFDLKYSQIL
jgi:hypothetical protein